MMAATANPWVIFVLGGPGAGKGTQCANIVKVRSARSLARYRLVHIASKTPLSRWYELCT